MSLVKFSSGTALLPSIKEDPLSLSARRERNMLMLSLLGFCDGRTALDYFVYNRKEIEVYTPAELVSLFPEKEFTALTLIEYILNNVKVIMDDPKEFVLDVSDVMEYWNSTISALIELLEESSLLDEEQSLRVEACYKDIANAVQRCKELGENGGNSDATETADSKSWQPFFTTNFSSNNENKFITRLREIYLNKNTGELFQNLENLCKSTDLSHVTSSDVQTNTAIEIMSASLFRTLKQYHFKDLKSERYNFLLSCFATLNISSFPLTAVSICFRKIAENRMKKIELLLKHIYDCRVLLPEFVDCKTPGPATSVLWQKLRDPESIKRFADPTLFTRCAICQKYPPEETNFAILDKCTHLLCIGCISQRFYEFWRTTCPYCATEIEEYTSRDMFLAYQARQSS